MSDWLYSLPDWLLLVIWAGSFALLIVVLPSLTHRLRPVNLLSRACSFLTKATPPYFTAANSSPPGWLLVCDSTHF